MKFSDGLSLDIIDALANNEKLYILFEVMSKKEMDDLKLDISKVIETSLTEVLLK